jgi:DNA end-binding protein Ku
VESTRTINIKEFIDEQELDPLFVEKSYYIAPDSIDRKRKKGKESSSSSTTTIQDKAYSLLVKVLHETRKVAIGKLVLKEGEKEHLIAMKAYQRGFIMHTLHYLDEIKPVEDIKEISEAKVPEIDKNEMSLGKLLVENLTSKDFDISRYHDEYVEELKDLVKAKAKGEVQVVRQAMKKPRQTQDLIAALKASLARPTASKNTKES